MLQKLPLYDQVAGYAGGDVAVALFLTLLAGPAPLAARGLAAVLARAGRASGGNRISTQQHEPGGCVASCRFG